MLKGMQAGVAAVIFDVVLSLGFGIIKQKKIVYYIIMFAAFAAALVILRWKKWNPILVMVLCGIVYLVVHLLSGVA